MHRCTCLYMCNTDVVCNNLKEVYIYGWSMHGLWLIFDIINYISIQIIIVILVLR